MTIKENCRGLFRENFVKKQFMIKAPFGAFIFFKLSFKWKLI